MSSVLTRSLGVSIEPSQSFDGVVRKEMSITSAAAEKHQPMKRTTIWCEFVHANSSPRSLNSDWRRAKRLSICSATVGSLLRAARALSQKATAERTSSSSSGKIIASPTYGSDM